MTYTREGSARWSMRMRVMVILAQNSGWISRPMSPIERMSWRGVMPYSSLIGRFFISGSSTMIAACSGRTPASISSCTTSALIGPAKR
jgi:hypothetical protein